MIKIIPDGIECNPDKLSGVPTIKGTRFSLAQLLAELADGHHRSIEAVGENFQLDKDQLVDVLHSLAVWFDKEYPKIINHFWENY